MTERDNYTENPQEQNFFPLSQETVQEVLQDIAENPHQALIHEVGVVEQNNPHLLHDLRVLSNLHGDIPEFYMRGVLFTHKLVRTQATMQGIILPTIATASLTSHLRDVMELTQGTDISFHEFSDQQLKRISQTDPHFVYGIREITKYDPSKQALHEGVVIMYSLMKKTQEAHAMKKQFGTFGNT